MKYRSFKKVLSLSLLSVILFVQNAAAETRHSNHQYFVAVTDAVVQYLAYAPGATRLQMQKQVEKEALFFARFGMVPLKKDSMLKGVYLVYSMNDKRVEKFREQSQYFRYIQANLESSTEIPEVKPQRTPYRPPVAIPSQKTVTRGRSAPLAVKSSSSATQKSTIQSQSVENPTDTSWALEANSGANVRNAWDTTTGDSSIVVAVLGSGIDLSHPDLVANLWKDSPGATFASTKESVNGFNVYSPAGSTEPPQDDHGVTTHAAGIIGARGDNGIGVSGVAWNVKLMPVRVGKKGAANRVDSSVDFLNQGIEYILKKKAQGHKIVAVYNFINFSSDPANLSSVLSEKIDMLAQQNILFITGAGDNQRSLPTQLSFPGDFTNSNLISVGSYYWNPNPALGDSNLQYSSLSNFGDTRVHLAAPGERIFSTWIASVNYTSFDGFTRDAAGYVAGVAVLIKAAFPEYSANQIKAKILSSVRKYPVELAGKVSTLGVLDAEKALTPPLPGDFDQNGTVDGSDFLLWQRNVGATDVGNPADGNGDGIVNQADLNIWRDNLGRTNIFPALPGDFDFNNSVDGNDFMILQRNMGAVGWGNPCDANIDGKVDGADQELWKSNFGKSL